MVRMINLLVLALNVMVLICGQLPGDVTATDEYRSLVYMLIQVTILLIFMDIFEAIIKFILDLFYMIKYGEKNQNNEIIAMGIALLVALVGSLLLGKIPIVNKIMNAIR